MTTSSYLFPPAIFRAIAGRRRLVAGTMAFLLISSWSFAQQYSFTTLSGPLDRARFVENAGAGVGFEFPSGVAIDRAGNVYVADGRRYDNMAHQIRKITPDGVVSRLDGSVAPVVGREEYDLSPAGIAVDDAGNVYVVDSSSRLRKVTPAGVVSTLAGSGTWGFADGTGVAAQFNNPTGLAVDKAGNIFVADKGNRRIRKVTPAGVVSTLAGSGVNGYADGNGTAAQFSSPNGVAVDGAGNLLVTDGSYGYPLGFPDDSEVTNFSVRKITPAGVVSTLAGSNVPGYVDAVGTAARFNFPYGVAVDSAGNVYVTDPWNRRIRKVTPEGAVSTIGGSGFSGLRDGTGAVAQFWFPAGVAVDSAGALYIADSGGCLRKAQVGAVQPAAQTVFPGATFSLAVISPGTEKTYQWLRDGVALSGQTLSSLLVSNAGSANAGSYTAVVSDASGTFTTNASQVTVSADASRLINLSCRINVRSGQVVIPSFVVQGTGSKQVLIRAVGPGLAGLGIPDVMTDPQFTVFSGSTQIAANDNWDAGIADTFTRVGAFSLPIGSKDAALLASLPAGRAYTVQVSGAGSSSGIVLIEIYDADGVTTTSKLVNTSVRGSAGSGADALVLGFVVKGIGQRNLLIRGAGPALAAFGVQGRLADPELSVYNEYNLMVARNDQWESGDSANALGSATNTTGAFPFAAGSRDTATLVLLHTGSYTVQITSASNATGEALAEVYELP
jgi:sugar lactone lactonase YvrE